MYFSNILIYLFSQHICVKENVVSSNECATINDVLFCNNITDKPIIDLSSEDAKYLVIQNSNLSINEQLIPEELITLTILHSHIEWIHPMALSDRWELTRLILENVSFGSQIRNGIRDSSLYDVHFIHMQNLSTVPAIVMGPVTEGLHEIRFENITITSNNTMLSSIKSLINVDQVVFSNIILNTDDCRWAALLAWGMPGERHILDQKLESMKAENFFAEIKFTIDDDNALRISLLKHVEYNCWNCKELASELCHRHAKCKEKNGNMQCLCTGHHTMSNDYQCQNYPLRAAVAIAIAVSFLVLFIYYRSKFINLSKSILIEDMQNKSRSGESVNMTLTGRTQQSKVNSSILETSATTVSSSSVTAS
ncbi:hypothetical protein GJ496_009166 [Pomphorhynchus laevis]|nr:hypothetical protein GJ496_009166 [Pomphorhynchus laevis]